uniref:Secreted protein n=1 Tax=Steinernema glaseri TaxID=37863 RepID=A0A1I8AWY6_9BILA
MSKVIQRLVIWKNCQRVYCFTPVDKNDSNVAMITSTVVFNAFMCLSRSSGVPLIRSQDGGDSSLVSQMKMSVETRFSIRITVLALIKLEAPICGGQSHLKPLKTSVVSSFANASPKI